MPVNEEKRKKEEKRKEVRPVREGKKKREKKTPVREKERRVQEERWQSNKKKKIYKIWATVRSYCSKIAKILRYMMFDGVAFLVFYAKI